MQLNGGNTQDKDQANDLRRASKYDQENFALFEAGQQDVKIGVFPQS